MRRTVLALFVCGAGAWDAACSSTSQNVTSPSTVKCAVTASATPASFSAAGGSGTLAISTNRECAWSAAAASEWIRLGAATGQGESSVSFSVAANADPAVRRGTITIGSTQVGITQDAGSCAFTVDPRSDSVAADGGRKTIAVAASSPQCTWTARSDVDWLAILDGAQGTGNGQVRYDARATTGPARSGTLRIADRVVTITQGEGCATTIAPVDQSMAATGGTGTIALATGGGCSWSAQSNESWIAITSGQSGSGPGTIAFSVGPSDGPARTGTLTVGGHIVTVAQASGCRYAVDPAAQSFSDGGGSAIVTVRSGAGCTWTAAADAPWITIAAGSSGAGNGAINFSVAVNPMGGPARNGTIRVNDQTVAVSQAGGAACAYTLSPTSQDFSASGGSGSFTVTTVLTCPWSATANEPWITIDAPGRIAGSGTVTFTIAANPAGSPARVGTIDVRGPVFTINQAAGAAVGATSVLPH
jgi:Viral BACON domain/Putative binding domain, N-terminal